MGVGGLEPTAPGLRHVFNQPPQNTPETDRDRRHVDGAPEAMALHQRKWGPLLVGIGFLQVAGRVLEGVLEAAHEPLEVREEEGDRHGEARRHRGDALHGPVRGG